MKTPACSQLEIFANSYWYHPSIIKTKQAVNGSDVFDSERLSFKVLNETETKNLRNLDVKKISGIDTIHPKLKKLSA